MTRNSFVGLVVTTLCAGVLCLLVLLDGTSSGVSAAPFTPNRESAPRKPLRVGHPTFASPHAQPIAVVGGDIFVVNTPADTVDVIDAATQRIRTRINVGVDPVSVSPCARMRRKSGCRIMFRTRSASSTTMPKAQPICRSLRRSSSSTRSRRRQRSTNRSVSPSQAMKKLTSRCRLKTRSLWSTWPRVK